MPFDALNAQLEQGQIKPEMRAKWHALLAELSAYGSAVVAYSGGVDSAFLAFAAAHALGERMVAVTVASALDPAELLEEAARFAARHGFRQVVLSRDPLQDPAFRSNAPDRCYHCKTAILNDLWAYAREHGYQVVMEGQNQDDLSAYRPGRRAVAETGTRSPLANHHLTKSEIRALAKALGLAVWNQPSSPCLATRIPYGTPVTREALERIARAEAYLHQRGFAITRVRCHQDLARVEVPAEQIPAFIAIREEISRAFRDMGFLYTTLDLQGYRTGSMDEGLA